MHEIVQFADNGINICKRNIIDTSSDFKGRNTFCLLFCFFFHFLSFLVSKLEISACHFKLRLSWLHNQCLFLTFFLHFCIRFTFLEIVQIKIEDVFIFKTGCLSDHGKKEINVILEFSY